MVYNTGNGASLQKLPDKSQISGKRQQILLLEIEKKESKTLNTFQKLLNQIRQSPQDNQSRQEGQSSRRNVYEETAKNQLAIASISQASGNTGTNLNNPSKETIFGSNKIKEQHETIMKPQNEEVMLS